MNFSKTSSKTENTLRFGLFRLVAPSKARPSNSAKCAEPMSTRQPSPLRPATIPTTDSCGAGTYYSRPDSTLFSGPHKILGDDIGLTRRELLSTHHLLLFAELFTVPARVDIIESPDIWRSPGPSFKFTCWAGTGSPGRTMDDEEDMISSLSCGRGVAAKYSNETLYYILHRLHWTTWIMILMHQSPLNLRLISQNWAIYRKADVHKHRIIHLKNVLYTQTRRSGRHPS